MVAMLLLYSLVLGAGLAGFMVVLAIGIFATTGDRGAVLEALFLGANLKPHAVPVLFALIVGLPLGMLFVGLPIWAGLVRTLTLIEEPQVQAVRAKLLGRAPNE